MNYLRMIILEELFLERKKSILHEKDAFLLSDLLEDIKRLSELSGLTETIFLNTRTLKSRIIDKFSDDISFSPKGKYLVVCSSDVDLCQYALAYLKGKQLKDYHIIKTFGEMIRRKARKKSKALNGLTVLRRLLKC